MIGSSAFESRVARRIAAHRRFGVTLMELMITMAILALLAAAIIGASSSAMESARRARTKTMVSRLHALLMDRWATYPTRRVDVGNVSGMSPKDAADLRLLALRELLKLEIPDQWADVIGDTVANLPPSKAVGRDRNAPWTLTSTPAITKIYFRRYQSLLTDDVDKILENQGAECLYMTIMLGGDSETASLFSERDIGDMDEDGAPEFLDGWGRPIRFIRWPTGYVSSLQSVDLQETKDYDQDGQLDLGDYVNDHDPLDVFRRDMPSGESGLNQFAFLRDVFGAYATTPLIYSSGPDGVADIGVRPPQLNLLALDPYHSDRLGGAVVPPESAENENGADDSTDNITNHLLD